MQPDVLITQVLEKDDTDKLTYQSISYAEESNHTCIITLPPPVLTVSRLSGFFVLVFWIKIDFFPDCSLMFAISAECLTDSGFLNSVVHLGRTGLQFSLCRP